ncbi:hypothetical protein [Polycladidibacter hongkongensis]|uniref:hypothetical protein n=1 Tax=Polycladidibacter hongkongensis TaxID=1647556 RepID=UPI000829BF4B|nr:hypothetical protein [Pseudovibrio hongkongensis]
MRLSAKIVLGSGAILIAGIIALSLTEASIAEQLVDTSGIDTIKVSGDSTALSIRSSQGSHTLKVEKQDKRWCNLDVIVRREGQQLNLDVQRRGFASSLFCDPTVWLDMPEEHNLTVQLDALAADIAGSFNKVEFSGNKTVLNFNGAAKAFRLAGDAGVFNVRFSEPIARDAVRIDVPLSVARVVYAD